MQINIKLHSVPPSMPPEALLITKNRADSASDDIDGGNLVFLIQFMYVDSKSEINWGVSLVIFEKLSFAEMCSEW